MDKVFLAKQANRALQLFAQNLELSEAESMEIADLYEAWQINKKYTAGKIIKYGVNKDNETQLYSVVKEHVSQSDWTPDKSGSLFKAIGFTPSGVSIWTQPLGSHDAYQKGDKVSFNTEIWTSDIDSNIWQPGIYGWTKNI